MIFETSRRSRALTTKMKSPMVTMMNGRLSRSRTGRTNALMIPSSREAPRSAPTGSHWIPGTSLLATKTAIVVTNQRMRNAAMQGSYFNENFFEDLFCKDGRFGCTNRFAMPKKKSEKEEKKRSPKKATAKAASPAAVEPAAVATKATSPAAGKSPAAPRKKAVKAPAISSDDIALRAYFIAERRQKMGWHGDSTGDWVEAERQLKAEATRKK